MLTDSPFEFFKEIERHFIRARGTPLLLSPDDYRVAKGWFEAGIPLEIVIEVLYEFFTENKKFAPLRVLDKKVKKKYAIIGGGRDACRSKEQRFNFKDLEDYLRKKGFYDFIDELHIIRTDRADIYDKEKKLFSLGVKVAKRLISTLPEGERTQFFRKLKTQLAKLPLAERREMEALLIYKYARTNLGLPSFTLR